MAQVVFTSNINVALQGSAEAKRRALEIIGGMAEGHAKEIAPKDSGTLANSITHQVDGNAAVIGSNVEYAPYVELGHAQEPGRYVPAIGKRLKADHVAARPYLRPAIENHIPEYQHVIETEFKRG